MVFMKCNNCGIHKQVEPRIEADRLIVTCSDCKNEWNPTIYPCAEIEAIFEAMKAASIKAVMEMDSYCKAGIARNQAVYNLINEIETIIGNSRKGNSIKKEPEHEIGKNWKIITIEAVNLGNGEQDND